MAIHDDNWTKEMPDMYTISKRERVVSGLIAILMAMVLVSLFVPAIGQYVMYVIGGAAVVGALYVLIASSYEVLTGKSFY
jgi:hypothetical protein